MILIRVCLGMCSSTVVSCAPSCPLQLQSSSSGMCYAASLTKSFETYRRMRECCSTLACRQVFQELVRLGGVEQQALLTKQLDELQGPITFCRCMLEPCMLVILTRIVALCFLQSLLLEADRCSLARTHRKCCAFMLQVQAEVGRGG